MKQKDLFVSLKNRQQISFLFKSAARVSTENLLVRYVVVPGQVQPVQVLWAIPRSIKSASRRNRLRRVLKAVFYQSLSAEQGPKLYNLQLAVVAREKFELLPMPERLQETDKLLHKLLQKLPVSAHV